MREVEQTLEEAERRVEDARRLEEVGWLPSSLPTQQLAQMTAEAGPSVLGEEPAKRKLHPTVGGKAPWKEFLKAGKVKKDQEVLAWHSCPSRDPAVPMISYFCTAQPRGAGATF